MKNSFLRMACWSSSSRNVNFLAGNLTSQVRNS